MNVIDIRVRPPVGSLMELEIFPKPSEERTKSFGWFAPLSPSIRKRSFDLFKEELDEVGVVHSVIWGREVTGRPEVSTSTREIAGIIADNPRQFSGFHGVGLPAPGTMRKVVDGVREALAMPGIIGITVDAQTAMPPQPFSDDARFYPAFEACDRLGGILALTISRGNEISDNIEYSNPETLDRLAGDFPRMDIIVSHGCWPWATASCGVAFRRPNVYLVPDLYAIGMPGYLDWVRAANTFLEDRMIFGSAYPRLGVVDMVRGYDALPFANERIRRKVMYENAARLLSKHGVRLDGATAHSVRQPS
jgi:predicted TIM-barrel fold metal-dependent hydrolase